jgi:predicted transposase YbfD/YdcC
MYKETSFYFKLQNLAGLDLRDNRGKTHDLAFVLLGLSIALLRKRDGNLSSLHRSMENKHQELCDFLGLCDSTEVISRSYLPVCLKKVSLPHFELLLFEKYGIELNDEQKKWFAGDGKELRGSIETGKKRGEALVQLVDQESRQVLGQSYYNGDKESEKPCLRNLLTTSLASGQKISLDALHLCPATCELINKAGGTFLIGLKKNQAVLLEDMKFYIQTAKPIFQSEEWEKGHGRIEYRKYELYDISHEYFDSRWEKVGFCSLVKVERKRINTKTQEENKETSFYISNKNAKIGEELFKAIRNHWQIEVNNNIRDTTFQEDQLKTQKKTVSKVLSGLRTLSLALLNILKPKNMVAQLEKFQDDFQSLLNFLRQTNFL